jgi:phosphoribosylanthranilate isomerase
MRLELDRFFVKICGVTSEEDALMSVGFGASAIGFILAPSPRQMSPAAVGDIVRRLPSETVTVGVFRNEQPERVAEIANSIGLSAVQLHGNETLESVRYVAERVRTVIRAVPANSDRLAVIDEAGLDYLMLDGENPGSGERHDWHVFGERTFQTPVIAAGGLNPDNVVALVRDLPVWGVDAASGLESAPGVKDPALVADFINNARWAYEQRDDQIDDRPFDWSRG